jgi:hypothetical protein
VPVIAHLLDGWALVTHVMAKILLLVLVSGNASLEELGDDRR